MLDSSTSPRMLADLLGTTYSNLVYQVYTLGVKDSYTTFSVPKKSGEERVISAPKPQLKNIQRRLKNLLDELYKPHQAASAFIDGRGILYNTKKHVRKAAVFNIDLIDFYGQINFGRVRGILLSKPYDLPAKTATLIANICCLNNSLPQGAPTSPTISNMICRRLDRELSLLAKENRAFYTRYADDITFSFRSDSENQIYVIDNGNLFASSQLQEIIADNGFAINESKTRINLWNERQTVTGLKVNKKVNVDRRYIRTTRAMIHSMSRDLSAAQQRYLEQEDLESGRVENKALGRINFIGMVKGRESSVYQSLAQKFNNIGLGVSAPLHPKSENNLRKRLNFDTQNSRGHLEHTVWVLDFELKEFGDDFPLIQGTAFMIKSGFLIACAHTFAKAGDVDMCNLYRINNTSVKYKGKVIEINQHTDLALIQLLDVEGQKFPVLRIDLDPEKNIGYQASVVGFPELQSGHKSVTVFQCAISNTFAKSGVSYFEVDKTIQAGCSGGPVLNAFMQVIGVAAMGLNVTTIGTVTVSENDQTGSEQSNFPSVALSIDSTLDGNNAFISAMHIHDLIEGIPEAAKLTSK